MHTVTWRSFSSWNDGTGLRSHPRPTLGGRARRAPRPVAVVAQRRDHVGDRARRRGRGRARSRCTRAWPRAGGRRSTCGSCGERQWSKSAPGSTSGDAFVQSVESEIRFEIDEPSPTGRAAHVRALVSSTQPPRASAIRNDEKYGSSVTVLAAAALAVLGERGGDRLERVVGRAAAFEAEPHEIHAR